MQSRGFTVLIAVSFLLLDPHRESAQIFPTLPNQSSDQVFRHDANEFAESYNALMHEHEQGLWSVEKARKTEELFERLKKNPGWRVR